MVLPLALYYFGDNKLVRRLSGWARSLPVARECASSTASWLAAAAAAAWRVVELSRADHQVTPTWQPSGQTAAK